LPRFKASVVLMKSNASGLMDSSFAMDAMAAAPGSVGDGSHRNGSALIRFPDSLLAPVLQSRESLSFPIGIESPWLQSVSPTRPVFFLVLHGRAAQRLRALRPESRAFGQSCG
jgi:hypothetical protein